MRIVTELHHRAMEFVDRSLLARAAGDSAQAAELLHQAYEAERQAALSVEGSMEPTRSVLLRSAASLALETGDARAAEQLVATGLAGEPPPEVADELRDLLEQAYFKRHGAGMRRFRWTRNPGWYVARGWRVLSRWHGVDWANWLVGR